MLIRETGPAGWLRVTVGTPQEMAAFRAALAEVLRDQHEPHRAGNPRDEGDQAPRRDRPRRAGHGPGRDRRAVLRPHAGPARQARAARPHRAGRRRHRTSTRTTPSRTPRSRSAPRCGRRWATRPASSGSATRSCRWMRPSSGPPSTCRAARTWCTTEPAGMSPMIGSYDTTLTRHIWESLAFSAGICLHVHVLYGRNPHHIVEAQFKAVARALRAAAAHDPRAAEPSPPRRACFRMPALRSAPEVSSLTVGLAVPAEVRRPRLRVGEPPIRRAGPGPRGRRGVGDRRPGRRARLRRPAWCPASARSRPAWPGSAGSAATR